MVDGGTELTVEVVVIDEELLEVDKELLEVDDWTDEDDELLEVEAGVDDDDAELDVGVPLLAAKELVAAEELLTEPRPEELELPLLLPAGEVAKDELPGD